MNDLGMRIKAYAKQRGITQKELAELVGITDVSLSRYVNGSRKPRINILVNIANTLGVSVSDLLGEHSVEKDYYQILQLVDKNVLFFTARQKTKIIETLFEQQEERGDKE